MNLVAVARRLALLFMLALCMVAGATLFASDPTSVAQAPQASSLAATVVVEERGSVAGNADDARQTTFAFASNNAPVQLVRLNKSAIDGASVPNVYGVNRGMTIYAAGKDVASPSYDAFSGPLVPVGADLSRAAGWPNITAPAGQVAIDPVLGRFTFNNGGAPYQKGRSGSGSHNAVALQGDYAYVTDWERGLYIYDIADPASPTYVGNWERVVGMEDGVIDVVVDGRYAYLSTKWHGLYVIDVLDPAHPIEVASSRPFNPQYSLHLVKVGNLILMSAEANGVLLYDVSSPTAPTYLGRCYKDQIFAESVYVQGQYAYVAVGNGGLSIWNIAVPTLPTFVGELEGLSYCWDVHVVGEYAYLAATNALRVVNIANKANPVLIEEASTIGWAYDIYVYGGHAVVGERDGGGYVQVFDLQNPAAPLLIRTYSISNTGPSGVMGVRARNGLLYAAANAKGLVIIDPNLPQAPRGAVTVDYNWLDNVEPPTPTPTLDPSMTITLTLQVERQGRGPAPSERWAEPLWLQVAEPGGEGSLYTYETTADASGLASVAGVPQGVYDVLVRGRTSLFNACVACALAADGPTMGMGLLAEGDANLDGYINILDFSLMASSYGSAEGDPAFDPRVDFNGDGSIQLSDFSLLASNYGMVGPLNAVER